MPGANGRIDRIVVALGDVHFGTAVYVEKARELHVSWQMRTCGKAGR